MEACPGRLFGLVFLFVMGNVHEIGHTVTARLLGDGSAHYLLYQVHGQSTCLGCNLYDSSSLRDTANTLVNFGGVIVMPPIFPATTSHSPACGHDRRAGGRPVGPG